MNNRKLTWEEVLARVSCVRNMPPRRKLETEPPSSLPAEEVRQLTLFAAEGTISAEQAGQKGVSRPC